MQASKWLVAEQSEWKFGSRGLMGCICTVLFMCDSLSSVWCNSVHFANFPMLRYSRATAPPVFIQYQPNLIQSMVINGKYKLLFDYLPKFTNICHFLMISHLSYIEIIHKAIFPGGGGGGQRVERSLHIPGPLFKKFFYLGPKKG